MITPDSATCSADECDEPTPMDMSGIVIDQKVWVCSPECAHEVVDAVGELPRVIALVDPQFRVDRGDLPHVDDDQVGIEWSVGDREHAHEMIDRAAELHDAPFRYSPDA